MKKFYLILLILSTLIIIPNVYAKDTVFSINKHKEEIFNFIKDSYNEDLKIDGNVVAGTYLKQEIKDEEKKDTIYNDYQIMVIKYNKKGHIVWNFSYGKNSSDSIYDFSYSYDNNGNIDGYLLVIPNSYQVISDDNYEKEENPNKSPIFLKIDLEGNLIKEEFMNLSDNSKVIKIIPSYDNNQVNGYISISTNDNNYQITKYNLDFTTRFNKEYKLDNELVNIDIIPNLVDDSLKGYILLQEEIKENEETTKLLLINNNGDIDSTINDNIKTYNNKLLKTKNGFILYGITDEVKLKKGNDTYYLKKYNNNYEEEWEVFGNTLVDKNKTLSLKEGEEDKYFLLYRTNKSSIEVITLEKEGNEINKIKKITNDYYTIEDFNIRKNTLYFIGQINCPEDDNCEYDKNSLFLISDEDKVIEVKEEDTTNVLLVAGIIVLLIVIIIMIRKRKTSN